MIPFEIRKEVGRVFMESTEKIHMSCNYPAPWPHDQKERLLRNFTEISEKCGSIVEAELLAAIMFSLDSTGFSFIIGVVEPLKRKHIGRISVQAPLGKPYPYKADILLDCNFWEIYDPLHIIVECDGKDHKMDNQYRHDRKRDRWMQIHGYQVLRFPTDEIKRHGHLFCALEVKKAIIEHIKREKLNFKTRMKRVENLLHFDRSILE